METNRKDTAKVTKTAVHLTTKNVLKFIETCCDVKGDKTDVLRFKVISEII